MKKLFTFITFISLVTTASAQNVGIGTPTPNPSAQLDITSTNKGLLLPRMTSFSRSLIINPANGLMVYDTTLNRLYQYQDGTWRFLINNSYWVQSTTRNWVYNGTDSVGIGTTIPTQRLDVNGNIRSRDDILADGRVVATGIVSGSGLTTSGGLSVSANGLIGGNFTANGDLSTNSDLIVNNSAASLTLKSNGVDKGFAQLNGNDLRIGTFSSNNTGKFVVRTNGGDHFTVDANGNAGLGIDPPGPGLKFTVLGKSRFIANGGDGIESFGKIVLNQGGEAMRITGNDPAINFFEGGTQRGYIWAIDNSLNMGTSQANGVVALLSNQINLTAPIVNVDGKVTATTTGTSYNLLPVCYGKVSAEGTKTGGTPNFTVTRIREGTYEIRSAQITSASVVSVTSISGFFDVTVNANVSSGSLFIYSRRDGSGIDNPFHFIIIDP
jgi:hypothetical protein